MNSSFANDPYLEAMQKSIEAVYHATSIEQYQHEINTLQRIAAAEPKRWEPAYYAGFCYLMMANLEVDARKKDRYLDEAMISIQGAKQIAGEDSEVLTLEGFVYMMRVSVDPGTRGPEFAPLAMQKFDSAVQANPENPRALTLMARMQYGTAEFFGSSTSEACENANKGRLMFETYKSENPLAPQWGKRIAESLMQNCK
jgi:hypothetical protein